MRFRGKQVLITGGTGALGSAVVTALLAEGATCRVPYRNAREIDAAPWRRDPQVVLVEIGDLADEGGAARAFADAPELWASLHIAGGFAFAPLAEATAASIRAQVETNLVSTLLCCREAVRAIRRGGEGGRIVNVAARPALEWRQGANMAAYAASKAGVAALTVALAEEVAREGILVNAVAPSVIDTSANRTAMPKADHASWPKVGDVAATILFLASPENRATRGAVVPVYGKA